jgi:hypothetical protein
VEFVDGGEIARRQAVEAAAGSAQRLLDRPAIVPDPEQCGSTASAIGS